MLVQQDLLAEEPRVGQRRLAADERTRRLDRVEGAVVRTEELADVAELLVNVRDVANVELGKVRAGGNRAPVQLGGDDVGKARLSALARGDRVRPRLVVDTTPRSSGARAVRRSRRPRRSSAPATRQWMSRRRSEGQTFVRGGANEVVPERVRHVARVPDELAQPLPASGIRRVGNLVLQDLGDEVELERPTDDRRVAQEHPVLGIERVDARREQAFDRLGERLEPVAGSGCVDELAHEEWVAARALRERRQRIARQGELVGHAQSKLGGAVGGQRLEDDSLRRPVEMHARFDSGPRRDTDEPWTRRLLLREPEQQRARRVVEPVARPRRRSA